MDHKPFLLNIWKITYFWGVLAFLVPPISTSHTDDLLMMIALQNLCYWGGAVNNQLSVSDSYSGGTWYESRPGSYRDNEVWFNQIKPNWY